MQRNGCSQTPSRCDQALVCRCDTLRATACADKGSSECVLALHADKLLHEQQAADDAAKTLVKPFFA